MWMEWKTVAFSLRWQISRQSRTADASFFIFCHVIEIFLVANVHKLLKYGSEPLCHISMSQKREKLPRINDMAKDSSQFVNHT